MDIVGRARSRKFGEGAFLDANGHEIKSGIDAGQADFAVAIGIFSTTRIIATVSEFRSVFFSGGG